MTFGPFNIPLQVIAGIFSFLIAYIIFRLSTKISRDKQKKGFDIIINSILIAIVVWKFSPILFHFKDIQFDIIALVYYPPGLIELLFAGVFTVGYLSFSVIKHKIYSEKENMQWLILIIAFAILFPVFNTILPLLTIETLENPSISLISDTEETVTLDFSQNDETILHFWTSWCPSCKAEQSVLNSFFKESNDSNFYPIFILSENENFSTLESFAKELNYPLYIAQQNSDLNRFEVKSVPTTLIINSEGEIIERKIGALGELWLDANVRFNNLQTN